MKIDICFDRDKTSDNCILLDSNHGISVKIFHVLSKFYITQESQDGGGGESNVTAGTTTDRHRSTIGIIKAVPTYASFLIEKKATTKRTSTCSRLLQREEEEEQEEGEEKEEEGNVPNEQIST